jgi:hypothetical protein
MSEHRIDLDTLAAKLNGHSIFAPSSSARWLSCPGSLIPCLLVDDPAGEDAATGTVAHGVAEQWLKAGIRPSELIGTIEKVDEGHTVYEIPITAEMLDYVEQYVDWCEYLSGDHFIETKVYFSDLTPLDRQGGTADHAACQYGVLTITDLKFGQGVQVFARDNTQALLYAYGFFLEYDWLYDFQQIVIRIAQPRLHHFDTWEISREELLDFTEFVKPRAALAWTPNAPRVAGEKQCQFCAIKGTCPALLLAAEKLTEGVFEALDDEVTEEAVESLRERLRIDAQPTIVSALDMTTGDLSRALLWRKTVEGWFKAVADELYRRLDLGEEVPEWKLADGKNKRDWSSEQSASGHLTFLGLDDDDIFERSMISPAKAEKALVEQGYKRKQLPQLLDPFVTKTRGATTMVRASDKREAIATGSPFGNLDDDL